MIDTIKATPNLYNEVNNDRLYYRDENDRYRKNKKVLGHSLRGQPDEFIMPAIRLLNCMLINGYQN